MARTAKKIDHEAVEMAEQHVEVATAPVVEMVAKPTEPTGPYIPTVNLDELRAKYLTKSSQIRFLFSQGLTRGQIAKVLGIRYQHVRNVLITPLKSESAPTQPAPQVEAETKTE